MSHTEIDPGEFRARHGEGHRTPILTNYRSARRWAKQHLVGDFCMVELSCIEGARFHFEREEDAIATVVVGRPYDVSWKTGLARDAMAHHSGFAAEEQGSCQKCGDIDRNRRGRLAAELRYLSQAEKLIDEFPAEIERKRSDLERRVRVHRASIDRLRVQLGVGEGET